MSAASVGPRPGRRAAASASWMPARSRSVDVGRVATDEVDAVAGRVPVGSWIRTIFARYSSACSSSTRSRAVAFQPQMTMWPWNPAAPMPWPSLSKKSMTSATKAPVIVPSIATPKRMSSQLTSQPPGEVAKAESPCPKMVVMLQYIASPSDSNVHGFSRRVMASAATRTTTKRPLTRATKKRRSRLRLTRDMCQATRRTSGTSKRWARRWKFDTAAIPERFPMLDDRTALRPCGAVSCRHGRTSRAAGGDRRAA